jgi:hypothetical protein
MQLLPSIVAVCDWWELELLAQVALVAESASLEPQFSALPSGWQQALAFAS